MTGEAIWQEPEPVPVPEDLTAWVGGHPLVAKLLVKRGIQTIPEARAFLDPDSYTPSPPAELPGLETAAERVIRAVETGEKICVWGDFDVDGQTATALLVEALQDLGADVFHHIPVRKTESHGIGVEKLGEMIDRGARLILTCDTGSAAHEAIAYANNRGAEVIVTDHHKLAATHPPAFAFTNPQLLDDGHPLKTLPGVGVAWKLVEYLSDRLRKPGLADRGLDLAALGIVADVAELEGDTRWLLQRGIAALREDRRVGLRELYALAGIDPAAIDTETIGFGIAPRLNAIGRLGDANPVVEFLTTGDVTRARVLANRLEGLNGERKLITDQISASALAMIEADPSLRSGPALVLARQGWEPGVIGIVAARLVETFSVPAVLIAVDPDGTGRGSARSVDGIDITAAIAEAADLLETFGGHTMAAGLSIRSDRIDEFRLRLNAGIRTHSPIRPFAHSLSIDGYLALPEIDITLISDLDRLAPFGPGSPRPLLATRDLEIRSSAQIGRDGDHRRVVVADRDEAVQEVLWWGGGAEDLPTGRFDLAYTLGLNVYRGERRVQVTWKGMREIEPGPGEAPRSRSGGPSVIDLRQAEDPGRELERLRARGGLVVWGGEEEPEPEAGQPVTLAVWTIPSGPDELAALIARYEPHEVVLFGNPPPDEELNQFIRRMIGLLKYAVRAYDGRISIDQLVAATRQSRGTVTAGLAWLAESGNFNIERENDSVNVMRGSGQKSGKLEEAGEILKRLLDESAAFRRYYLRADPENLVEKPDTGGSRR